MYLEKKQKIIEQLSALGIEKGDTLLVRADLGAIGRIDKDRLSYVNFLIEAVGDEGTIVGLAFTGGSFYKGDKKKAFDGKNKANTGAFSNVMLSHPSAIRSKHPMNSYVAIGKNARFIVENHDENQSAYEPIKKLIELDGKMLLIGCAGTSPGFTTTHLAEVELGLHRRIIFPWLNVCYFLKEDGEMALFRRWDLGGCSSTFYKLYSYYVKKEILKQGYIGNAYTLIANAREAFDIDLEVLSKDPKLNICDNSNCTMCRVRRWDNLKDIPLFLAKKIVKFLFFKNNIGKKDR
jgi:aminoglycoside N3'-acetyltransferase